MKAEATGDNAKSEAMLKAMEKDGTRAKPEFGSVWYHFSGPDKDHLTAPHDHRRAGRHRRVARTARERARRRRVDHECGDDDRPPHDPRTMTAAAQSRVIAQELKARVPTSRSCRGERGRQVLTGREG